MAHTETSLTRRWFGVGSSSADDVSVAGKEAVRDAMRGSDPRLVIVFASVDHDLAALVAAVADEAGEVPLVGCTTVGEIVSGVSGDAGVVVAILGGPGFVVRTSAAVEPASMRDAAFRLVGATAVDVPGDWHRVLLLLSDFTAGDPQESVMGAFRAAGARVPIIGGCAGDGGRSGAGPPVTHQFHGRDVHRRALVVATIASDAPIGVGVGHGWEPFGDPMLVTAADGQTLLELDGRPALDVWLERIGCTEEDLGDGCGDRLALEHPVGVVTRRDYAVRCLIGAEPERRGLLGIATFRVGELVWSLRTDAAALRAGAGDARERALHRLGGRGALGMLAFDCGARRRIMADDATAGTSGNIAGPEATPVAGFFTYGEFARTKGARGHHNQSIVVAAFA